MTKRVPKLDLLNTVVGRAVAELNRPPTEEEGSKAIYPLPAYLDGKGRKVVWQMVSKLHEQAPETYDRFLGDHFLADLIVDVVAERDALTTWPDLISALDQYAEQERDWLVAVPLANLMPPRGYVPLSETAGLGMAAQGRDRDGIGEPPMNSLDVFRHLRDRLGAGLRWRSEDSRLGPLDTRRTAALLLVEPGTQSVALSTAQTRARYALAIWCLLHSPNSESYELWPFLADWEPRPFLEHGIERKRYEPETWTGGVSSLGRDITEWGPYELPDDQEILGAPFAALAAAPERASARAVVSGAWALHIAERQPNDLERTDELLFLTAAIEAMCDLGEHTATQEFEENDQQGSTTKRWARITHRHGIWNDLRGPYTAQEIKQAQQLTRNLRNITAHGADDVLVNLGYPPELRRRLLGGKILTGTELSLARAASATPVLRHAVRNVLERLARGAIENGWADDWFRAQFEANDGS